MEFRNNNEAWIEASKQGFPAFVLDLSCSLSCYDITFEATKTSVEFKVGL
jgi:DNA mismatch repair ATPase MutL